MKQTDAELAVLIESLAACDVGVGPHWLVWVYQLELLARLTGATK